MRKLLLVLLIFVCVGSLSACEQSEPDSSVDSHVSHVEPSQLQTTEDSQPSQDKGNTQTAQNSHATGTKPATTVNSTRTTEAPAPSQDKGNTHTTQNGRSTETTFAPTGNTTRTGMATESTPSTTTGTDAEEPSRDELVGVNALRVDYDLGTCRNLSGDVSVILFYMDDFESSWTDEEIIAFTEKEIKPGLSFLEKEAKKRGVELHLSIQQRYSSLFYDDDVVLSVRETGLATIDVLQQAAVCLNYRTDDEMISAFKDAYGTEVICLTIFNKNGTAYAINPHRGATLEVVEHCIIFASDLNSTGNDPVGSQASVVAHELLHLFGAEDFYTTASRKALAKAYYSADIMLSAKYYIIANNIGDATAFYIGWTDEVPALLYDENW